MISSAIIFIICEDAENGIRDHRLRRLYVKLIRTGALGRGGSLEEDFYFPGVLVRKCCGTRRWKNEALVDTGIIHFSAVEYIWVVCLRAGFFTFICDA